MDRSFNSSLIGKSPFSPRSRPTVGSKRILPTSFRKSSRISVSGKSSQSAQIILSSPYNYVERFGTPLPVLVTEALTFADKNTIISAKISQQGYAWIVCGRRLLIWQYRQGSASLTPHTPKKVSLNQCFELQLPQSDLAHRADLVAILTDTSSNTPSCIAVSPEGVVRYWPSIVHEGVSIEQHVNLQGQECDNLTDMEGLGCILATTTCTVLLIQPQVSSGKHTLKCKTLKIPTGWLGGISKRMSSLIFGPIQNEQSTETRLVRVLSINNEPDLWTVYILADHSLQKWHLSSSQDTEELIYVVELNRLVRDCFRNTLWENSVSDPSEITTWLLDIQADKDNIIILAAGVYMPISLRIHYAMICLQTNQSQPPTTVKDFLLLKITDLYHEDKKHQILSYRFILCGIYAYLYNQRSITVIKPQEDPDILEFNTPQQDFILAGSVCVNTPIFILRTNGLVAVNSNELGNDLNLSVTCPSTPVETSFNDTAVVNNLSIYNMDPEDISRAYKDSVGQLKAAFIFHLKNQQSASKEIIEELFPADSSKLPGIDSLLDKLVVMLCKELVDAVPADDPRWPKEIPTGLGSSYSMQILHQLEDKERAYSLFMRFLKESNLWNQLAAFTIRNTTTATVYVLAELAEKIVAAIVLKSFPTTDGGVLEKTIKKVVENMEDTIAENNLTNQDIFYRHISKIHVGLQELVNYCEDVCHSDVELSQVVDVLTETNELILTVLKRVLKYRQQNLETFQLSPHLQSLAAEYLPWTAANGSEGISDSLILLHYLTYNYGILLTHNDRQKSILWENLISITDMLLYGRKAHLESINQTTQKQILYKQYSADRQKYVKPFLQEKEWERAAQIAEKYLDFETLVIICESTDNQLRLDEYTERFTDEGFSEFLYNWYLKENKEGKLMDKYRKIGKTKSFNNFSTFLSDHPSLSWMQYIFDKKFDSASDTLNNLANEESDSLQRQKTMYSLCKLTKLAATNADDSKLFLDNIGKRLELISFQEELPDYVLQQYGYDIMNQRVIPPKDIIRLYTCKEYKEASELEFKKALDLLNYIYDDDLKQELLLEVWSNAILRDSWDHANLDSPIEILQNKLFFRIIDFALVIGNDILNQLPSLDTILADESLRELQTNTNFQFLMKTGYEHVYRTHSLES